MESNDRHRGRALASLYFRTSFSQCIGKYAEAVARLDDKYDEAILVSCSTGPTDYAWADF